jgi:hypothetical protein
MPTKGMRLIMENIWQGKVSNRSQLGGIETSVLDNGAGRGVRIAWVNTGSPLRYKVVLDRAMDIGDTFYSQHCLSWISRQGITAPQFSDFKGLEWLRSFGGGLVATCGLSHVGGPEPDGSNGLHGRISNIPAEIISIEQPDIERGITRMAITGLIRESSVFGPHLELRRTISSELGEAVIRIHDEVTNCGNTSVPHMLLYHCNLGWPLIDEGTKLNLTGKIRSRSVAPGDDKIFNDKNDFTCCPLPFEDHAGFGEACGFSEAVADGDGLCRVGAFNRKLGLKLSIGFDPEQLPCFTNWQHWAAGEYVTGLEPGTNFPVGQAAARDMGTLIVMEPGESRTYNLEIKASLTDPGN